MILIIDDDEKNILSLVEDLGNMLKCKVAYRHPNHAIDFISENPWVFDWVLVDEVFELGTLFTYKSGTELGAKIHREFDFIPTILFTANDKTITRGSRAINDGFFCDALEKDKLDFANIIESEEGEVTEITEREALGSSIKRITSGRLFRERSDYRAQKRLEIIEKKIRGLKKEEKALFFEKYDNHQNLLDHVFKFADEEVSLHDLFYGWFDTNGVSESRLRLKIGETNIVPVVFKFDDAECQAAYERYKKQENHARRQEIEFRALNIILTLLDIPEKFNTGGEPYFKLTGKKELALAKKTFAKTYKNYDEIFTEKMIARRVCLSVQLVDQIGLEVVTAFFSRGSNNANLIRKERITKGRKIRIDYNNFLLTKLHLHVSNKNIRKLKGDLLDEEEKWCLDIDKLIEDSQCIVASIIPNYGKDLDDICEYLISCKNDLEAYEAAIEKITEYCNNNNEQLLPLINFAIEQI